MSRGTTVLLLGLALTATGCREDRCKSAEPAFQLDVLLSAGVDGSRVASLAVVIDAAGLHKEQILDVTGKLADGSTSFAVSVSSRTAGAFVVDVNVQARDELGRVLARGQGRHAATPDACNFFTLTLAPETGDLANDVPRGDTQARSDRVPDRPGDTSQQGKTCSASGVTFTASAPPVACGTIALTVSTSQPYNWVMASVRDAAGKTQWSAPDASKAACCYSFSFPTLKVPCTGAVPPFSFAFMKDATYENPAAGVIVASCVP